MTATLLPRPRPPRRPQRPSARVIRWRPTPVPAPPLADQLAAWSSDLGRLDLI